MRCHTLLAIFLPCLGALSNATWAQVPAPPLLYSPRPTAGNPELDLFDSKWQLSAGLGLTSARGNSRTTAFNATMEASRTTDNSKLSFTGRGLYAKFNKQVTGSNGALGTQYDRDISPLWFGFGNFEYAVDRPANIASRFTGYLGFGRHVVRRENHQWDLATGVGYAQDRFVRSALVAGQLRDNYGRVEGVLSESSSHKITRTATLRQKLGIFPNFQENGAYRVVFDAGVAVSISASINLTSGLTYRYDSDPGVGLKKTDSLLVTGLSVKFD
jgi:putative salt-induced outer membrane protein